jgi:transcriptional regulator of acetoin/glycerol metabolism
MVPIPDVPPSGGDGRENGTWGDRDYRKLRGFVCIWSASFEYSASGWLNRHASPESTTMPSSETLHAERIQTAIASQSSASSALVASWRRSSAHHLDPANKRLPLRVTDSELKRARQAVEPFLRVAQPILDRLFTAVRSSGCCVMLADRNGIPIDRRGEAADDRTFESWGLWQGSVWSEASEGTNGIGTCIVEQRALSIHRGEHFFARNTLLSCITAPIFDHEGNLAAALDVSSCRADLVESFVNLVSLAVSDAARRIEADHFRMSFPNSRIMLAPVPDSQSGVMLAVDANDVIVGASRSAREMLGITQKWIDRETPVSKFVAGRAGTKDAFFTAERHVLQRALAEARGNVSAAAKALGVSRSTLHRKLKKTAKTSSV